MPSRRLQMTYRGRPEAAQPHLSVDGMSPHGPNLSHWPGNRTPRRYAADLSTGICLNFVRAPADEQAAFLGDATSVLNDHYDTDGFGSLLAITRPELALARERLCLEAAATGDFQTFGGWRGFAVDRIVLELANPDLSPIAGEFAGLAPEDLGYARYRWLLDEAERVLDDPRAFASLYQDELALQRAELDRCRGGALERELHPACGLAILTSREPLRRMTLNTLAGEYRVLHVELGSDGPRYRYHDRTESWFELATFHPPARRDLRPLARTLQELEGHPGAQAWCADPPTEPIPELYFGVPGRQAYGRSTRTLGPSRLAPAAVRAALLAFLAEASIQEK